MSLRAVVVSLLAVLSLAASAAAASRDWNAVVSVTPEGGHLIGDPAAPVKLVEYVSYTCPHCAHFETEAAVPLQLTFIAPGKGSVEYRPLLRNKIDVAVSLAVACGPVSKFRGNHALILRSQDKWFGDFSSAQQQRWASPDFGTAMRAIASDLKLYDLMAGRGYSQAQLDRCITDKNAGSKLAQQSSYAVDKLGVNATPSFLINGNLQDAHSWGELQPILADVTR